MKLQKAQMDDFEVIKEFYMNIIDNTENMERHARWIKGLHPTDEGIKGYIEGNEMYLFMDGDKIAGAMAVTMEQGEAYHNILWSIKAEDNEVAVIHILGVNPEYQRKGIGRQMIDESIQLAKDNCKKAVRLDALASNTPARHMYEARGFEYKGKLNLYAENTGWTDFCFYEYAL